jgi:hypothetical protein
MRNRKSKRKDRSKEKVMVKLQIIVVYSYVKDGTKRSVIKTELVELRKRSSVSKYMKETKRKVRKSTFNHIFSSTVINWTAFYKAKKISSGTLVIK